MNNDIAEQAEKIRHTGKAQAAAFPEELADEAVHILRETAARATTIFMHRCDPGARRVG